MYMYNVHVYVHCYMCVHVSVITFTTFRTTAVVNIPANIQHVCTCIRTILMSYSTLNTDLMIGNELLFWY